MDIYREEILEHWRNPQNFGEMKLPTLVIDQVNPLCGDEVKFYFKIERVKELKSKSKVVDVSFTGNGCAISIASASILSDFIKGKKVSVLSKITGEDVLALIGGTITPARLKCAFLPLEAIKKVVGSR